MKSVWISLLLLGFSNIIFGQKITFPSIEESGLQFLWPTNASNELTSSFAEYRATHYHYGIDIKTWNKIGYDVYAAEDGYVSRLRVNPNGYGKAIYLTHKNGYVTVYGHLNGFNGKIKSFVENEHYKLEKNELNVYLKPNQIKVKRGELIAFSGETGVGTPHLHWEIRDPAENEINPMNLKWEKYNDHISPTITKIAFKPINLYSTINQQPNTLILSDLFEKSDTVYSKTTPTLTGTIGVLLDGYDVSDGKYNKFGFHRVELLVDRTPYYTIEYSTFPIDESKYILVERDAELLSIGKGRFTRLYQQENNPLPFYTLYQSNKGQLENLTNGKHEVLINTFDFSGNKKTAVIEFFYQKQIPTYLAQIDKKPIRRNVNINDFSLTPNSSNLKLNSLSGFETFYNYSSSSEKTITPKIDDVHYFILNSHLRVTISGNNISKNNFLIAVKNGNQNLMPDNIIPDSNWVHFLFPVEQESADKGYQICLAANNEIVWTDHIPFTFVGENLTTPIRMASGTYISVQPNTFFSDVWLSVEESRNKITLKDYELSFGPNTIPFKNNLQVKIPLPTNIKNKNKIGIYLVKKNGYGFQSGNVINEWLTASIGGMGQYVLLEDNTPPTIEKPNIPKKVFFSWPEKLKVRVSDKLSGINSRSIVVTINGKWNLAEYDEEEDFILIPTSKFEKVKQINLTVSVSDAVSNIAKKSFKLSLSK